MSKKARYLLLTLFLFAAGTAIGQNVEQKLAERTRILFVLDGSGSMRAPFGKETRMDVAKEILTYLIDSLQVNKKLELGLRVYGHQYLARYQNCKDSKLEVPFSKNNHQQLIQKINNLQPKGVTPIAYSLEQAAHDFPTDKNYRNILILITDGIESCDGDPCEVSLALQKQHVFLKPFIIGFGLEKEYESRFDCLGQFFNAQNPRAFYKSLNEILKQSLEKTTASVKLLDKYGKPDVTDVNVSFVNHMTHQNVFDFVHYLYPNGEPDTVEVDAVLTYDLRVNTIPPVYKNKVSFVGGRHNVVSIQAPQGSLQLRQQNATEYPGGVNIIVQKNGQLIHSQRMGETVRYLMGTYDVTAMTLPRTTFHNVKIDQDHPLLFNIPAPGRLNVKAEFEGYGSLYQIDEEGQSHWITRLEDNKTNYSIAMQPGNYKLVYRAKKALGSKYTETRDFTIQSGKSTTINVY